MQVLNRGSFAIAFGIVWGLVHFIFGIGAMLGWSNAYVDVLSSIYIGYGPTIIGAIVGAIWAFVCGTITALIFAYIYNAFSRGAK